jgi:hypothetical protein
VGQLKLLDFIVIGAQKGGTTSLYKWLQKHPRIIMPPEKEAPFFTPETTYRGGWTSYVKDVLPHAVPDAVWGKVTTWYMADPDVPRRIARTMPDVKLIALLRNPLERTCSHYRMCVRRGWEERGFDTAIESLLEENHLKRTRCMVPSAETEPASYVAWSEYGRILQNYLDYFAPTQVRIYFTDQLSREPEHVLDDILAFIGLDVGFRPGNLGKRYHVGGVSYRFPLLARLMKGRLYDEMWRVLPTDVTRRIKRRVDFWAEIWNTKPSRESEQISLSTRRRLIAHFAPDVAKLKALFRTAVPWVEYE